jgi:hypothetical protein
LVEEAAVDDEGLSTRLYPYGGDVRGADMSAA